MAWAAARSFAITALLWATAAAQSTAHSPQAKTREELDAFGLIFEAANPSAEATAAESFLHLFPDSEFSEQAQLAAMHSRYDLGDIPRSRELALAALTTNPESPDALLHSARLIVAPGFESPSQFAEARRLAEAGISRVKSMKIPTSADSRVWLRTRNSFLAVGTSVLGWLAFHEGKPDLAAGLLQQAAAYDPRGEYFYRLSLLPASNHRDLSGWASRAIQAGPEWITVLARHRLKRLNQNEAR